MDVLLGRLVARGVLDDAATAWARRSQADSGTPLDTALLELDLVDEETLLETMQQRFGLPVARPPIVVPRDPALAARFPIDFSRSFLMCPVAIHDHELTVLVAGAIPVHWLGELRELFGIEVKRLLTTSHGLALAREQFYESPADERTHRLEERLARRRSAPSVGDVAGRLEQVIGLARATDEVLDFAAARVDFACLLASTTSGLRIMARRGDGPEAGTVIAFPDPGCTAAAALRHGGYCFGPPVGTEQDRRFFETLRRQVPATLFVAPVPGFRSPPLTLLADNGPRGMAHRWIAELVLLVARLGRTARETKARVESRPTATTPLPAVADPSPQPLSPSEGEGPLGAALSAAELAAVQRLRAAATRAGQPFETFVDALLSREETQLEAAPARTEPAAAIADEVKGLFDRLATDIPAQLAQGIASAFREMLPRLAGSAPPAAEPATAAVPTLVAPTPVAAAPREVASYQSRRKKVPRTPL